MATLGPNTSAASEPSGADAPRVADTIRVRADRLERLITMVSELVVAQAMICEDGLIADDVVSHLEGSLALKNKAFRATRLVRELHGAAIGLRMVPLGPVFQLIAREARDAAKENRAPVTVLFEGHTTELDRETVEVVSEALVVLVRSILAHAIDGPQERTKLGKPPVAQVRVSAHRVASEVEITIQHDGWAIDPEAVVKRARRLKILGGTASPSADAAFALLFERGMATADAGTELRGCIPGLDTLKSLIDALHGSMGMTSTPGRGTSFTLRLPLNSVLTDGVLVRVGIHRYLLPLKNVLSFFKPDPSACFTIAERGEFVRVRGETMPVIRLGDLVGVPGVGLDEGILVILVVGGRHFAVLVDQLVARQEVLAKSMAPLRTSPIVAGSAVLSDGRVGLVLDPEGLMIDIVASSRAWLDVIADLGAAAADYLRLGTSSAPLPTNAEPRGRGVSITLLSVATQIEVRISVALDEAGADKLAGHLFGEADPELAQELLNELANIFMGTLKRSFSAETFAFTGGLPEVIAGTEALTRDASCRFEKTGRILADGAEVLVQAAMRTRAKRILPMSGLVEGMVLARDVVDGRGSPIAERGMRLSEKTIEELRGRANPTQRFEVITP